jgi:LysM repeat protein
MVLKIHIVKKGDTLYELAKKYQTTLDQIIALNPQIADPNQIEIGMKVKIPSVPKHVDPPASDFVYKHVVQQGDSLWKLGKAWDVPLQAMIKANAHLKNPNVLMTGDVVYVPKMQHGHGHMHSNQHHTHHTTSKLSTEPFAPVPMTQPMPPADAYQQPIIPSPQVPVDEAPPLSTGETVPAAPQVIDQAPMASPVIPAPVTDGLELHEPYGQAVHPFQQFHITATEVFAYPEQQHEAMTYPAYSPYQEEPCEPLPTMVAPVSVVDEGCGCGGPAMNEHPWMNYPASYSNVPMGNPWDSMPEAMPAFYPPPMPYDHPMAQHYAYQHDPYGIPYAGAQQHAPYESSLLPQVHTHELKKVSDTLEEIEIDIRDKQKEDKPKSNGSRSTRKVKLSGTSALSSFLQQQQRATEKRETSKPNSPWINF